MCHLLSSVENLPLFFFCFCCPERYIRVDAKRGTPGPQGDYGCQVTCLEHGGVLMPLYSDNDKNIIINSLPEKQSIFHVVITNAINIVDKNGHSTFFSKPGGKRINFIDFSTFNEEFLLRRDTRSHILLYNRGPYGYHWSQFYIIYRWVLSTHHRFECFCKVQGELCFYNCHADFDAI